MSHWPVYNPILPDCLYYSLIGIRGLEARSGKYDPTEERGPQFGQFLRSSKLFGKLLFIRKKESAQGVPNAESLTQ